MRLWDVSYSRLFDKKKSLENAYTGSLNAEHDSIFASQVPWYVHFVWIVAYGQLLKRQSTDFSSEVLHPTANCSRSDKSTRSCCRAAGQSSWESTNFAWWSETCPRTPSGPRSRPSLPSCSFGSNCCEWRVGRKTSSLRLCLWWCRKVRRTLDTRVIRMKKSFVTLLCNRWC